MLSIIFFIQYPLKSIKQTGTADFSVQQCLFALDKAQNEYGYNDGTYYAPKTHSIVLPRQRLYINAVLNSVLLQNTKKLQFFSKNMAQDLEICRNPAYNISV